MRIRISTKNLIAFLTEFHLLQETFKIFNLTDSKIQKRKEKTVNIKNLHEIVPLH